MENKVLIQFRARTVTMKTGAFARSAGKPFRNLDTP